MVVKSGLPEILAAITAIFKLINPKEHGESRVRRVWLIQLKPAVGDLSYIPAKLIEAAEQLSSEPEAEVG
jgi:hypothetical protein